MLIDTYLVDDTCIEYEFRAASFFPGRPSRSGHPLDPSGEDGEVELAEDVTVYVEGGETVTFGLDFALAAVAASRDWTLEHARSEVERMTWEHTRLEGIGYQTDLGGTPIGRAPIGKLREDALEVLGPNADETEIQAWISARTKPLLDLLKAHNKRHDQWLMLDSQPYRSIDDRQAPSPVLEWAFDVVRSTLKACEEAADDEPEVEEHRYYDGWRDPDWEVRQ